MTERRVWIAQCLCGSKRHAILACSAEADDHNDAERNAEQPLRETVSQMLKQHQINPWCGLCGAPHEEWRYEVGPTAFKSMEEALPALADAQAVNIAVNILMGGHPGPGKLNR